MERHVSTAATANFGTNSRTNPAQSNTTSATEARLNAAGGDAMSGRLCERLFESLIAGDRPAARTVVGEAVSRGLGHAELISEIFWPTYENLDKLFRTDRISTLAHHMATRLLRVLIDQAAARMVCSPTRGRRVLAVCGSTDADELAAQMAVDLIEAGGFSVSFGGGCISNDDMLTRINESQPDIVLMFASSPSDLPNIRQLIDTVRAIDGCPNVQFAVGAGVFNRADGLAEEIGADLWACSPMEMVDLLVDEPARRANSTQRTVGKARKVKKAA